MLIRPFFNLGKPQIKYARLKGTLSPPVMLETPPQVKLLLKGSQEMPLGFQTGDNLMTGQKLSFEPASADYVIAPLSGTISSLAPFVGNYGQNYIEITVDTAEAESLDAQFKNLSKPFSLETALNFLLEIPGKPPLQYFSNPDQPIHTIVICGFDHDLLVGTNQYFIESHLGDINSGIHALKTITDIKNIFVALPKDSIQGIGEIEAEIIGVEPFYPAGLHPIIMKEALHQVLPAGSRPEDVGVVFITAEAAASLGRAFTHGQIPGTKILTLIQKDKSTLLVEAKIGTPIRDIFNALNITLQENDRLILGGPMTGTAIYSEDYPILADTDAVMIQDSRDIPYISDYPCINCGECVRICPAQIQVHMLVRFLEAAQYEEAAESYDLYSCLECGLCSFVCVSKIPIFQYIRLAKYELARMRLLEAADD